MEIRWELFPSEAAAIGPALDRAIAHMDATGWLYALVMQKGSVATYPLRPGADAIDVRASRAPATGGVVTGGACETCFPAGGLAGGGHSDYSWLHRRPGVDRLLWPRVVCSRRPAQPPLHGGSMGRVVPLALGLALARPDLRVVALDGDGAALMRMGAFATVGAYGLPNLRHLLLDNGAHDSTGGQATASPNVSFAQVAAACSYASSLETDALSSPLRLGWTSRRSTGRASRAC